MMISKYITSILLFVCYALNVAAQNKNYDKDITLSPKNTVEYLNELLVLSENEKYAPSALLYSEKALNIADSLKLINEKITALKLSGIAYKNTGNYLMSIERLSTAVKLAEKKSDKLETAILKRQLGETYRATRNYDTAKELLYEALDELKKHGNAEQIARTYNRLAATYLETFITNKDLSSFQNEMTAKNEEYTVVLDKYPELKKISDRTWLYIGKVNQIIANKNLHAIKISTDNIEAALLGLYHKNKEAINKLNLIIENIYKYEVYDDLPLVLINKANIYLHCFDNPDTAISYLQEALLKAKESGIKIYEVIANLNLHIAYAKLHDYENAYYKLLAFSNQWREVHNEDLKQMLAARKFENRMIMREIEQKNRINVFIIILISMVLVLLILSLHLYNNRKKNIRNKILLEELKLKTELITQKNNELSLINAKKDKLFTIIGHDLKSPFQAIHGFSELLIEDVKNNQNENLIYFSNAILVSSKNALDMLNNLLDWARSQTDKMEYNAVTYNLGVLIEKAIEPIMANAIKKQISIKRNIPPDISIVADRDMFSTIIRNIVSNAIKFSHKGQDVFIDAKKDGDKVQISIIDNGIGIPQIILNDLFSLDKPIGRVGTNDEPSTGLGLILCKELVEKHGGNISVESEENQGTIFSFTI